MRKTNSAQDVANLGDDFTRQQASPLSSKYDVLRSILPLRLSICSYLQCVCVYPSLPQTDPDHSSLQQSGHRMWDSSSVRKPRPMSPVSHFEHLKQSGCHCRLSNAMNFGSSTPTESPKQTQPLSQCILCVCLACVISMSQNITDTP